MKKVSVDEMGEAHLSWCSKMTEIFNRGVEEAIAENKRLGLTTNESTRYPVSETPIETSLVSEDDS